MSGGDPARPAHCLQIHRLEKQGTGDPDFQLQPSAPRRSSLVLRVQRKTAYPYLGRGQEIREDVFVENWAFQSVVLGWKISIKSLPESHLITFITRKVIKAST